MRLRTSIGAIGIAAALALTGCATSAGDSVSGSGAALTIAKPDGAITTESHNPYLGDSSASKYGYAKVIFETLALVNPTGDLSTTPWLAESVEWNDDYTELTVVPRSGVTWSDGTAFTGDDIVFTFDQFLNGTLADTSGLKYEGATVDGDAITLTFGDSKYVAQARVLHTPIVPKHIWENIEDPNTDPLTEEGLAVGTGPYVLDNWSTESVTLTANPNYWGGDLAVPELHYVSYGDNAALTTALVSGEADWAQAFIPQIEASYLAADEANHFLVSPTAGAGTLFMNLQTKPFNDPALREALAWTIDRQAYVDIAREGASEAIWSVTGLSDLLENEILPEYSGQNYKVDVDKAKQILTDAGYTWQNDSLIDPDGEAVSFSISVPAGWSDWNTEQALIAEELSEGLGIDVNVDQPDWGGWDAARQEGTFQAIIHWLEDTGNAYGLYTSTMDTKWIVDDRAQFNFGRFDDSAVTEALNTYANTASDDERTAALEVIQKAFVDNVPAIPLGAHPLLGEYNTRNYVGFPTEDDQYASADPTQPGIVQILAKLTPTS
ncbi:ABC transporter substrate-binding protein [Salinibacterium sp. NSLL150]|uniref:ABC transporter substrate-binding protein n=1 Tax=unclassified Salinibacterium TaxID=2632331 RepID=UPI0018CE3E85|nr:MULTISPECIES: ABC transporter substrate-binding protein [unclassified Salinibacterium]MBH0100262.1 ABC transporter substrate-binding protein [Salinibacterium sp. NSLL35]MBH0103016.1 ABC transporter substrate-binding protein [Salinibacterium sp. NSLL150]MBH0105776.1 ABC transporter substrate-binding protein [Salinibacterium sp. NSLL16]MBH0108536.1 ABC transporter substrate-binding protein [Salinibacterium sp. NSLL17]MBH0111311.1 ABC transporter substrate-binding protein [Salinibacterium sp. 